MGYTTHADSDLIGFGVSAISHIGESYSQNPRDLPSWQAALDEGRLPVFRGMFLSDDDALRADLIQSLMSVSYTHLDVYKRQLFQRTRLQPPACTVHTFPSWRPQRAIDHILLGEGLACAGMEAVPAAGSDHLALSVELQVPAGLLG